jgi:hypothetical protein
MERRIYSARTRMRSNRFKVLQHVYKKRTASQVARFFVKEIEQVDLSQGLEGLLAPALIYQK